MGKWLTEEQQGWLEEIRAARPSESVMKRWLRYARAEVAELERRNPGDRGGLRSSHETA
jgi:hypothetical protein